MEISKLPNGKLFLKGLEKPEITGFSSENSLQNLGQERVNSLKKAISEIKRLIEERKELSRNFLKEGEEIKQEISNLILENENTIRNPLQGQNEGLIEKSSLRNKKVEISELQLKEKIDCWKDIALLKKELRIYEKELSEKESRLKELNELMKEN